jgi:hypothetical protein
VALLFDIPATAAFLERPLRFLATRCLTMWPSGAIRGTVALLFDIPATAAFLEWPLRFFATWCLTVSLRFAVAFDRDDAALAIGQRFLARYAGRRLPP